MVWVIKIVSTLLLLGALTLGFRARPPARPASPGELAALGLGIVLLDVAGVIALFAHRTALGAVAIGVGLVLCSIALWIARGERRPPEESGESDPPPPPPTPDFDWEFYESLLERDFTRSSSH